MLYILYYVPYYYTVLYYTIPYYTITCWVLSELTTDNQKYYTLLRTGTNSGSKLTMIMEGTKLLGPYPINHKLQSLID